MGGDSLSITKGIVSRLTLVRYSAAVRLLGIQVRLGCGGWGGNWQLAVGVATARAETVAWLCKADGVVGAGGWWEVRGRWPSAALLGRCSRTGVSTQRGMPMCLMMLRLPPGSGG